MIISLLILLILAWSFYIGYSRGIVLQAYYLLSAIVAFFIASQSYQGLARFLSLWVPYSSAIEGATTYYFPNNQLFHLDKVFYAGLAFFIIYTFVYAIGRFIGIFIHLVPKGNTDSRWYNVASGIIAVFISLFAIEMFLTIFATVPLAFIQDRLNHSGLASFIINHTPITSSLLKYFWVTKVIG